MSVRQVACYLISILAAPVVALYIKGQHKRLMKDAVGIPDEMMHALAPYFAADVLSTARLFVADHLPLSKLPFSSVLRHCGLYVPSPYTIAAITFDSVVAAREHLPARMLFHELVHVVQYRLLGVDRFARQYVEGFLTEGSYERIPLECCALMLEEYFASDCTPFSVEDAVLLWSKKHDLCEG